jgi:hypothetical protein
MGLEIEIYRKIVMTQEQKDLLLKDLCARLPYGVVLEQTYKVTVIATNTEEVLTRKIELYSINTLDDMTVSGIHNDGEEEICFFEEVKPYLFPLSSMTERQIFEINEILGGNFEIDKYGITDLIRNKRTTLSYLELNALFEYFNKNHFDYRGLIEKGLAIDATGLNIY